MEFKLWLENQYKFNMRRLPLILQGLAAEAIKAGSYEEFEKDFHHEHKHGLYWHWTNDPFFKINSARGPRDASTMSAGDSEDVGKLMISSDISAWSHWGNRSYVAIVDMTEVPRNAYRQVKRGFGNEFMVSDPSKAKVIQVLPRQKAFSKDRQQRLHLPGSQEDLRAFYDNVIAFYNDREADSPFI